MVCTPFIDRKTASNFNPPMAKAAKVTIAEVGRTLIFLKSREFNVYPICEKKMVPFVS